MAQASPIDVVEAAYRVEGTRETWLRGVLEAAEPLLRPCTFVGGYFIDASRDAGKPIEGALALGGPAALADIVTAAHRGSPDVSRIMHEHGSRRATTASELLPPLGLWSEFERLGTSQAQIGVPMADLLGIVGLDAAGRGVLIGCGYKRRVKLDRSTRARWTRTSVHLASGERLRRALEADPLRAAEAILTPFGRVEHAEGDAKAGAALQLLRTRAVAVDRARGRQRRSDPDAALEAWRGLAAGRWSLVDRFESDGRRYVLAHRNEPMPARVLTLTLRERQVVAHRVVGHSSKIAAYALGVSPAAISGALRSAMLKLGVRNPTQLLHRVQEALAKAVAGPAR